MADAETLFAEYHDRLFRYLSRAARHSEAARDLTQEVFLRVTRTAAPARSDETTAAWIFRIARNVVLDHHRQERRQPEPAALSNAVAAAAASQETSVAINEALATLPDIDRDLFLMREVGGLGYREIAGACDLTEDAIRSRIHRARLQLRARLAAPISQRRSSPMRLAGDDR